MATAALDPTQPQQTATIPDADPSQAPSGADGIQAGYQAPAQPAAPQDAGYAQPDTPPKAGTGARMLHGILSALGGTQDTTYQVQDGKLVASQIPSGPGMQFKRIIAGAVAGLAAGAGETGPGHLGRALAAGTGAGMQQAQQQTQQAKQQAEQDYDQQQKAMVQKAQMASLNQSTAASTWELSRKQVEAAQVDQDHQTARTQTIKDAGGYEVGHAPDFQTFLKMHAQDPSLVRDNAQHLLVAIPRSTGDGKLDGVDIYHLPDDPNNKPLEKDAPIQREVAAKTPGADGPDGQPTWKTDTIPAGSMSVGAYARATAAVTNRQLDLAKQVQATKDTKSQTDLREAQAAEARAGAVQKTGENATTIQKARIEAGAQLGVQQLKNGTVGGLPTDDAGQVDMSKVPPAAQEAMKRVATGQTALEEELGRRATQPQRQAFLAGVQQFNPNFSTRTAPAMRHAYQDLTSPNGKGFGEIQANNAYLGHLYDFSQAVQGLRNTKSPLLNMPWNKLMSQAAGDPALARVIAPMVAARTQYLNLLNNNHALSKEDVEEGKKLLDENKSPAQIDGAAKGMAKTGAIQIRTLADGQRALFNGTVPVPVITPDSVKALQHFGLADEAQRLSAGAAGQQQQNTPPLSALKPGVITHFGNNTSWTVGPNGQPQQVQSGR